MRSRSRSLGPTLGDLVSNIFSPPEPGAAVADRMLEEGGKQAAAHRAAEEAADQAFYADMHDKYGMVPPVSDPEPVEKASDVEQAQPVEQSQNDAPASVPSSEPDPQGD